MRKYPDVQDGNGPMYCYSHVFLWVRSDRVQPRDVIRVLTGSVTSHC